MLAALLSRDRARGRSDARLQDGRDRSLHHLLLGAARRRRAPRRRRRRARASRVVAGARQGADGEDADLPRRRHRLRERLRDDVAAQHDPALRDRPGRVLRARRSRRLAVRPGRARVHAHPPPRHLRGPADDLQLDLRQDLGAEPDHAALDDRGHRGLRGVEALRRWSQPWHALRFVSSGSRATPTTTSGSTRSPARRAAIRAATRAYVYGSHFLRYVFDRYGDDKLREMSHVSGAYPVPFAINRQIAKVVGKPFTELYDDWKDYLRDATAWKRWRRSGAACASGRRAHARRRVRAVAALLRRRQGAVLARSTTATRCRGSSAMPVGGDVDAGARRRPDRRDGSVRPAARQLAGLRAGPPVPPRLLVRGCVPLGLRDEADDADHDRQARARSGGVARRSARRVLAQRALQQRARRAGARARTHPNRSCIDGERYDEVYQPAWSPDGTRIAFSAWRTRRLSRHPRRSSSRPARSTAITHDRAIDMSPAWSSDGKLLFFDSDRTGISNIYAYDLAANATWQVTNVLGGAFHGKPSPDGTRLAYENAAALGGYDVYEIPLDRANWLPAREFVDDQADAARHPRRRSAGLAAAPVSRPRDARAASVDAVGSTALSHSREHPDQRRRRGRACTTTRSRSGSTRDTRDTDIGASYAYTGWRPALRVSAARTMVDRGGWKVDGVNKTYREEDWSGTLSLGIPLESGRARRGRCRSTTTPTTTGSRSRRSMSLDPNQRESTHPPTELPPGRCRDAPRVLADPQHDVRARLARRLRCERVAAARSPGVRRAVSQASP